MRDFEDLFIGTAIKLSLNRWYIYIYIYIFKGKNIYELLNPSFQGVKRLAVLAYFIVAGADADEVAGIKDNRKSLLPRWKINNYNVLTDEINIYDQPIIDLIKQSDEVRKVSTGQGDDCTTGDLLDYAYFKDKYRLIAVDLNKQEALDADPRAIRQIVFQWVAGGNHGTKLRLYTIIEK